MVESRSVVVCVALGALAMVLFWLSLVLGDFPIPLRDILPAALGSGDANGAFIVHTLRLPRAITAVFVGAAFGLSGAIFQRLTRNVLASPDIIGITAGASAGAVLLIVVLDASAIMVSVGALAGGVIAATAVYLLAWRNGITGYRLVLIGIGITAVLVAGVHYLMTRAQMTEASQAQVWLTGSLNARGWDHVTTVGAALLLLAPVALACSRGLRALQLGDDTAQGLGVRVNHLRAVLVATGVGLAAIATAAAGPIAFVALASAPLAARLTATGGVALAPAALVGSCVVLGADLVAQHLLGGLPVGVATALVGAPYLLFLLTRSTRIGVQA